MTPTQKLIEALIAIAVGRKGGKPIASEDARSMARMTLTECGISWGGEMRPWRQVLDWPGRSIDMASKSVVCRRYADLWLTRNPNAQGGSVEQLAELDAALDQALAELRK